MFIGENQFQSEHFQINKKNEHRFCSIFEYYKSRKSQFSLLCSNTFEYLNQMIDCLKKLYTIFWCLAYFLMVWQFNARFDFMIKNIFIFCPEAVKYLRFRYKSMQDIDKFLQSNNSLVIWSLQLSGIMRNSIENQILLWSNYDYRVFVFIFYWNRILFHVSSEVQWSSRNFFRLNLKTFSINTRNHRNNHITCIFVVSEERTKV